MIKDFMGQVKVADVQAAFDEIIDRINKQVDIYNDTAGYGDIDYTKGSPKLSNAGYTLSIGGLKSVIDAYNGTLIGCKVYKLSDTAVLVSDGLYFKDGNVYRINSRVVSGQSDWDLSDLYYDIDNDTVMFKDGTTSGIVEVQTGWSQPTITSNTSCGVFTATYSSQNAYKITTSEGYTYQDTGTREIVGGSANIAWQFPKSIKISNISLNATNTVIPQTGNFILNIYADSERIYSGALSDVNLQLSNIETASLTFNIEFAGTAFGINYNIKNLVVTGNTNSYAIETGGVVTPSDNIIKISHLNWESGDLILNSIEGFQIEGNKGVSLTSQNRFISNKGVGGWETLNTENSGKFVAYLSPLRNANSSMNGTTTFMGIHLTGASSSNNNVERHHYVSAPISLIYIPKGATISDSKTGYSARNVFNSELNK